MTRNKLSTEDFLRRVAATESWDDLSSLRNDALATENLYRELFARCRESWEIPEIDDPYIFLVDVFTNASIFNRLPRYPEDTIPRCFALEEDRLAAPGTSTISSSLSDFQVSWECLSEGLLRFLDWTNVFCAGGAVAGCLAPLPDTVAAGSTATSRVQRRRYFHDTFLPGSDIDLFLYGLDEAAAEQKLLDIYEAVQAANPYEIRAVRSAHAVTLISQYPFRHVQIVLRLYNSPAEILMGFDVDACAVGYDGTAVYTCPRTCLAMKTQACWVDLSRRSPSYEMRLAKYAARGFEVCVPGLDRDRMDPFLYEKRFDQTQGLSRLLLLERLRTPEERLQYRLQGQLKNNTWQLRQKLQKATQEFHNLHRAEGTDGIVLPTSGPENSDYSTVFLPWGPDWNRDRTERVLRKKDKILNSTEFLPNGKVIKCRRPYKIHVYAIGEMAQVLEDPFPDDQPIPADTPAKALEGTVHGPVSWLVDNPGRQQIGSFHPITDDDWSQGAYFSHETASLIEAAIRNDAAAINSLLAACGDSNEKRMSLLLSRDFLGRSALHVAALAKSSAACATLLANANHYFLKARLADGRTALHLAAIRGYVDIIEMIMTTKKALGEVEDALDIDGADWELKLSPLQYAVVMGHVETVKILFRHEANARKIAVHKDKGRSASNLSLLALYATECGKPGSGAIQPILDLLLEHGASPTQVDTNGSTCWHRLATSATYSSLTALEMFLKAEASMQGGKPRGLDIIDSQMQTPLYAATVSGNAKAVHILLKYGATPIFERENWQARMQTASRSGGQRIYVYTCGIAGEALRCPITLAAKHADGPCLEAFLSHNPSLANVEIYPEDNHARRVVGQNVNDRELILHPLDVLNRTFLEVRGDVNAETRQAARLASLETTVANASTKVGEAQRQLHECASDAYKAHVWSLVTLRESQSLQVARFQVKAGAITEEDQQVEEEALRQISDARRILQNAGGISQERRAEQDAKSRAQSQRRDELLDPFQTISEMRCLDFTQAANMQWSHFRMPTSRTVGTDRERQNWIALMSATAGASVEAVRAAASTSKVCILDDFGNNPLFLAVRARNLEAVQVIFEAAKQQFENHIIEQKRIHEESEKTRLGDLKEGDGSTLKDQLKRLNNLDIAAGELPGDSGPTPDEMRQRLEASEAMALQQTTEESADATLTCSVSPQALLLCRAVVLTNELEEPQLCDLKRRLAKALPTAYPTGWEKNPVRLRPLELAVIRGDSDMVNGILQSAKSLFVNVVGVKESEEDRHVAVDDEISEGSEYSESVEEGSPDAAATHQMNLSQLRYLLTGEASGIPDLGGVTLLQLAIAVDSVEMLSTVARFARENSLPRGAVVFWKAEVEEDGGPRSAETKAQQDEENNIISNLCHGHYNVIPLWLSHGRINNETMQVHTTLLQFSLSVNSKNTRNALMAGDVDFSLLDWIINSTGRDSLEAEVGRIAASKEYHSGMKAVCMAATWILRHVQKHSVQQCELSARLIRPTALDGAGRTALFYAKADLIEDVTLSAVEAILKTNPDSTESLARATLLETITRRGSLTALMAASSAGEVERIRALLNAGCRRSYSCGPKHWGPVHLAIPSPRTENDDRDKQWATSRKIIEILLDGASSSDIEEALVSPRAEHTPIMLAASRGADDQTISLLTSKANDHLKAVLARRDSELNTTLHVATKSALECGANSFSGGEEDSGMAALGVFRRLPDIPDELGPNVENSRGVTSKELVLESITSVWDRLGSDLRAGRLQSQRGRKMPIEQRRTQIQKGPLPPRCKVSVKETDSKEPWGQSFSREVLSFFEKDECERRLGWKERLAVSFNQVQEVKKKVTEEARNSTQTTNLNRHSGGFTAKNEAYQSEPFGPPAVLAPHSQSRFSPHRHGTSEDRPQLWDGWPR